MIWRFPSSRRNRPSPIRKTTRPRKANPPLNLATPILEDRAPRNLSTSKKNRATPWPEMIVFDMDGVLVDVRGSFHRTVLQTVQFFTGRKGTHSQLHRWKN